MGSRSGHWALANLATKRRVARDSRVTEIMVGKTIEVDIENRVVLGILV
jgi:hypothetical protein